MEAGFLLCGGGGGGAITKELVVREADVTTGDDGG